MVGGFSFTVKEEVFPTIINFETIVHKMRFNHPHYSNVNSLITCAYESGFKCFYLIRETLEELAELEKKAKGEM